MQHIEVKVENDHIQLVTSAKPIAAISELIWNAYDADASEVIIELEKGPLTKLDLIRIVDNGTGISADTVKTLFQSLGGSWKKHAAKTNGGRLIHGEKGQGRFKAFALGGRVTWISSHSGKKFSISGDKSNLKQFSISDIIPASKTGCTVEIESVDRDFEIWAKDGFVDQVRDVFALQLYEDPRFRIIYDGEEVDAPEKLSRS